MTFEYAKAIIADYRSGKIDDPYVEITQSSKVINQRIRLQEIPDPLEKVQINGYTELHTSNKSNLEPTQFRVDYTIGYAFFHADAEGLTLTISYKGRGANFINAERVFVEETDGSISKTVKDVLDNIESTKQDIESSESVRNSNENTRISNEDTRNQQESLRQSQESVRQQQEDDRIQQESQRLDNEIDRENQETTRLQQEQDRMDAENVRISSEIERDTEENIRKSNEQTRIDNENTRISQEELRETAEQIREQKEDERQTNTATAISNAEDAADKANNTYLTTQLIFKTPVNTFADISTTYPNPEFSWTVTVLDTGYRYRYDGSSWVHFDTVVQTDAIVTVGEYRVQYNSEEQTLNFVFLGT